MVVKKSIYRCRQCGNTVESLWDGKPDIYCCAEPMAELAPNTVEEAALEKHIPVIEREGNRMTVRAGEVDHPMTKEHYILFIEVIDGEKVLRHDFREGDAKAEAVFLVGGENITARAFCNLHGLWKNG